MRLPLHALAFLAGIAWVESRPTLDFLAPAVPLLLIIATICGRYGPRLLATLALGIVWAGVRAALALAPPLPPELNGADLVLVGDVVSLPESSPGRVQFDFAPLRPAVAQLPARIRLSWYRAEPPPRAAERWRLEVRLRAPRGFANPGGYDYEGELFRDGIGAIGYVRGSGRNRLLGSHPAAHPVLALRAAIVHRIERALGDSPATGVVAGLAVGAAERISSTQWQVFAATGTTHLIAISGLHITMVAALTMLITQLLWRAPRAHTPRSVRADLTCLFGAAAALAYALLAGFSVPTQRTLIMLMVGLGATWLRRAQPPSHVLSLALIAVLMFDPNAVLTPGFWLSFLAVAAILIGVASLLEGQRAIRTFVATQAAVSIALVPVTVPLFGSVSLVAPLANLFAIPLFSGILVPGILLAIAIGGLAPAMGAWLLQVVAQIFTACWPPFEWAAKLPAALLHFGAPGVWQVVLLAVTAVVVMSPLPGMLRAPGLLVLASLLWGTPDRPAAGGFTVATLDVGQGLAVFVRTRSHSLLFDAGPSFRSGRSAGDLVVVPYLHHAGVRRLDMLVTSHADNDHVGGVAAVEHAFAIATARFGGDRPAVLAPATRCLQGEAWIWDAVRFEFVHPAGSQVWNDNNGSCVLRISGAGGSALLTGDIEADAEAALVARGAAPHADVIIVPHHGSRSSSSADLVRAVGARYAIVSAGADNRWGFPSEVVVERWCTAGAVVMDTARSGATTVRFTPAEGVAAPSARRLEHRRYWHSTTSAAGRSLCRGPLPSVARNSPPKQMFMRSGR